MIVRKNVCILVGRFQPLTKGHLKCVQQVWGLYKLPTLLCIIDVPMEKTNTKHPFPTDILIPMYSEFLKNDKRVAGILSIKSADIVRLTEQCRECGFEPTLWVCGSDRYSDYERQVDRYKEKAGLDPSFRCVEINRTATDISATRAREKLKEEDEIGFLKIFIPVPQKHLRDNEPFKTLLLYIKKQKN